MKRLLTKKQLRDKIGFGFAHIDRLESAGKLPKRIKVGFRVFWLEEEIDAVIDEWAASRESS